MILRSKSAPEFRAALEVRVKIHMLAPPLKALNGARFLPGPSVMARG